jgi:BlaR1 peptidase M56
VELGTTGWTGASVLHYVGQSILHAIIAAVIIEALMRAWRVERVGPRLALRLLALAFPLVVLPLFLLLAPFRADERFAREAIFVGWRWDALSVLGVGLARLAVYLLGSLGGVLFLLDFLPSIADGLRGSRHRQGPFLDVEGIEAEVRDLSERLGIRMPPVVVVGDDSAILHCEGILRSRLVVSSAALEALDADERRAAFAHELAHAAYRDPVFGWVLAVVRALMFFNPAVQIEARAVVGELERRADERSAALVGDRLALAGGLVKLFRVGHRLPDGAGPELGWPVVPGLVRRARASAIERRCRRLVGARPAPLPLATLRLALAGLTLSLLLFYVV